MDTEVNALTGIVVDAAVKLHIRLGPGLLESVYESILERELLRKGLQVRRQAVVPFEFEGMQFDDGLRIDLLINSMVVVELKSVEKIARVHPKQVLTYLRLLNLRAGLLLNFGAPSMREGIQRIVNGRYIPGDKCMGASN
jgi:GxxExxY protein